MLSIENIPPDPSHISLLKSSSSDERPSSDNKLVDLSNSDLDDDNNKFSIRDYVFRTRRKDIKTNWPFSQKNLQLCLKHGATNLLPPFQSVKGCAVDNPSTDKDNIVTSAEKHVKLDDDPVSTSSSGGRCIPKLAVDYRNINSSGSDREEVLRSTITSRSCSEIDSVPTTERSRCSGAEAVNLLEPLVRKPKGVVPPMSNKSGSTVQPPGKKCRLIVKLGNVADRNVEEDTSTNSFMVSEAMASKVCPVCKTFTSSSNTTLNAHIDQCLSGESTVKWTANPKVIKHRIKPRKTRLMVDIYATAKCCTLEDLDRRNGTNWASNPSLSVRETEVPAVEKLEKPPPVNLECTANEGAVYIDANGTKLRILSKFNDEQLPSSKPVNDPLQKKMVDGDKRSKFILTKKGKKNHIQKHHKLLKSASHSKRFCLSKQDHCPKIKSGQESTFSPRENVDKEDCLNKHLRSPDQMISNGLGTIKQWACSKRTGLTRKISDKDNHQLSGGDMSTGVQSDNDVLPRTDSFMKRSCLLKSPRSSVCLPESSQRMGDMLLEPQDEHNEEPSLQKKVDFSLSRSPLPSNKKRSLVLQRCKGKHLKVDDHSVNNSSADRQKITVDHALPVKKMRVGRNTDLLENTDNSEINCGQSTHHPSFSSNARMLSSLRKNLSSVSEGPACGVKCNLKWKTASLKKSSMSCSSESEEAEVFQTEGEKHCLRGNLSETNVQGSKSCDRVIVKRSKVLSIRKNREGIVASNVEGTLGLKNSQSSAEIHSDNETGSILAGASDAMGSVKVNHRSLNEKIMDPAASEFSERGDFMSFSKSMDAGSDEMSGPARSHCDSQLFSQEYKGSFLGTKTTPCAQDPILGVEGMLSAVETGKSMIDGNVDDITELGSNDGQGNYFLEVDPIPIPGPPGSFLPSPGRMSSEDLHGSSSLTSSRIQSSADHPEFVDQDSSGSPTSTASTVSNSTMARTGSRYSENLYDGGRDSSEMLRCHTGWEDKRSSFSGSTVDLQVENSVTLCQTANTGNDKDGLDKFNANTLFPGKGTFRFTNDKPCCCVRKEGASQGFALNHEESQLLQRRTMAPSPFPASENQLSGDSLNRPNSIILKSNSFSFSDSSSGPETNATKSSMGHTQFGISADSEFKLPIRDSESFSPSASNPVLRLMGKDLMVINKDEDSPLKRSTHSNSMNDLANTRLPSVSSGSLRNEDLNSFRQVDVHNRLVSHFPQSGGPVKHFDVRLLNGFKSQDSYSRPQQLSPTSPASFSCKSSGSGLMGSFGRPDYLGGCNLHTVPNGPNETCDMKKFVATPISHWQNATSVGNAVREIIVIDDSPENEANSAYTTGTGKSKSPTGIQMQISSGYTSRFVDLCENGPRGSPYSGSGVAQNANLPTQVNEIPAKWNVNPEGCSLVHPSSFSASSSPAGPFRSSLYYSPGFS